MTSPNFSSIGDEKVAAIAIAIITTLVLFVYAPTTIQFVALESLILGSTLFVLLATGPRAPPPPHPLKTPDLAKAYTLFHDKIEAFGSQSKAAGTLFRTISRDMQILDSHAPSEGLAPCSGYTEARHRIQLRTPEWRAIQRGLCTQESSDL